MSYNVQQEDLALLRQSQRTLYSKIELLDHSFKITGQLSGELINDNYSVDAGSDIRRTYKMTLYVKDSSFLVGSGKRIWLDKYIRVSVGLYNIRSRDINWYPVGIYLFEDASYSYSATTKELSLSCVDRMAELTGSRNGQLRGLGNSIPVGTSIREAIKGLVTDAGIVKYRIDDINKTVPYILEFGAGAYYYDAIKELRDLYAGWETFFDEEYFICQPHPTCISDPIVLDASTIDPLIISENTSINFTGVKNVIELWGKCLESDYYTQTIVLSANTYMATYDGLAGISDGLMFGFKANSDNASGASFKVNDLAAFPIVSEGNIPIPSGRIKNGKNYVVKYIVTGASSVFYFCGEYQISALAKLVSKEPSPEQKAADLLAEATTNISYVIEPSSPFCCDLEGIGEIRAVLADGEYANIFSDELATQRAKYELWLKTDLLDSISLEMIDIPWLDVNQKIEYRSNTTGITGIYLIKTKSGSSTSGTMSISCVKFQPNYSWTN